MKKMSKNLLSMALVIAMVLSLMPMSFAAEGDVPTDVKIVYDIVSRVGNWGASGDKPFTEATYESTNGFWAYDSNSTEVDNLGTVFLTNTNQGLYINGAGNWWAVKIKVPKTATYTPYVSYTTHKNNNGFQVYLASVDEYATPGAAISNGTLMLKKEDGTTKISGDYVADNGQENKIAELAEKEIPAGEYYLIYCNDNYSGWRIAGNFTLVEGKGNGNALMGGKISGVADELEIGDTATAAASAFLSMDGSAAGNFTYSSDSAAISIDANTGALTANTAGSATITATSADAVEGCNTITKTVKVNPEQDPDLTDAFNDAVVGSVPNDYIAPTVDSIDATGIVGTPVLQADGSYKITAPEAVDGRGEFLYWKKAMTTNEKIVSLVREFNYVPESEGRNILAAVYEGDVNLDAPKCYNANGQYLPDAEPIEADLPSMAGYGKACEWKQYKDTNVWVAQYEAETPIGGFNVHISGGNGDNEDASYGDPIICTTSDAHKELFGQYFKYWKRVDTDGTETILSRNETYSFKAWESCEIEGVYSNDPVNYNGPTRKILIDSFTAGDEIGVMAEFLGFGDNVVEKGIMFNGNRIAMTTVGNQFSVIADKEGTYKGYVIVEETDGLKLITDGSYEHN
ncbi:MAG: hypothetical protein IJF32_14290 [Oscillospiraceae bacterium]|nr:hypothetical protein [Oscillospiraceae bacterium]